MTDRDRPDDTWTSKLLVVPSQRTSGGHKPFRIRITRDTLGAMGEASIRELRNQGGRVLARVANGEHVIVTSDGEPVALLRPLPRRPLTAVALQDRFRSLPPLDPRRFRSDVDAIVDQGL